MKSKACCNICLNAVFTGVIFGLTGKYHDEGMDCNEDMVAWLYVIGGVHALGLLYAILYLFVSCCKSIRGPKMFLDLSSIIFVLFEVAWLIYGNMLTFDEANYCKDGSDGAVKLWKLMLSMVCIGYLLFFAFFCLICCSCCLCLVLCGVMKGEQAN